MPVPKALRALGGLGIAGLAATALGCFVLIEKLGRVRTMMTGSLLNGIAMILLAAGIANVDKTAGGYVAATGLYLFICSFSMTWLPCGFLCTFSLSPPWLASCADSFSSRWSRGHPPRDSHQGFVARNLGPMYASPLPPLSSVADDLFSRHHELCRGHGYPSWDRSDWVQVLHSLRHLQVRPPLHIPGAPN